MFVLQGNWFYLKFTAVFFACACQLVRTVRLHKMLSITNVLNFYTAVAEVVFISQLSKMIELCLKTVLFVYKCRVYMNSCINHPMHPRLVSA